VKDETIHVDDSVPYGWKMCRCDECGTTRQCTPGFDFYTRPNDKRKPTPIVCERCIVKSVFAVAPGATGGEEKE
jgi:hypothetical protein